LEIHQEHDMRTPVEMVKHGQKVQFTHYRQQQLWYATECGFAFPVPIDEAGDAAFLAEDKALLFLRYIRSHYEFITQARAAEEVL